MAGRGGGGFLVGLPVEVVMLLCSVQQAQRLGCLLFVPRLSASRICHLRDIYSTSHLCSFKFSVVWFNLVISNVSELRSKHVHVHVRGGSTVAWVILRART